MYIETESVSNSKVCWNLEPSLVVYFAEGVSIYINDNTPIRSCLLEADMSILPDGGAGCMEGNVEKGLGLLGIRIEGNIERTSSG